MRELSFDEALKKHFVEGFPKSCRQCGFFTPIEDYYSGLKEADPTCVGFCVMFMTAYPSEYWRPVYNEHLTCNQDVLSELYTKRLLEKL